MDDQKLTPESFRIAQQQIIRRLGEPKCDHVNGTLVVDENGVAFFSCESCGFHFAASQETLAQWRTEIPAVTSRITTIS